MENKESCVLYIVSDILLSYFLSFVALRFFSLFLAFLPSYLRMNWALMHDGMEWMDDSHVHMSCYAKSLGDIFFFLFYIL